MRYFVFLICAFVAACNSHEGAGTAPPSQDSGGRSLSTNAQADTAVGTAMPACYAYQTSNNLVLLKLKNLLPAVSGDLTYDFMGKDKNVGTITGAMSGDTLYANYNFMSEGKRSVREVAFVRQGGGFVEGYGDVEQKGDTVIFVNRATLSFTGTELKPVPCTEP